MPVFTFAGQKLGHIDDLVMEVNKGSIAFVVLKYRHDDKHFVLPYGSVEFDQANDRLKVDVADDVFDNTPGMAGYQSNAGS